MQLKVACTQAGVKCIPAAGLNFDRLPGKRSVQFARSGMEDGNATIRYENSALTVDSGYFHTSSRPTWMETSRCNDQECVPCDKRSSKADMDGCFVSAARNTVNDPIGFGLNTKEDSDMRYSEILLTLKCDHKDEMLGLRFRSFGRQSYGKMKAHPHTLACTHALGVACCCTAL